MNILLVGSGGREHALAWKIAQSKHLERLFIAPGNAGMALLAGAALKPGVAPKPGAAQIANVALSAKDTPGLLAFARHNAIDLAVIGPEDPLANGLADELSAAGIKVFGPSRAAARIEASKAFAKAFMQRHNIPTAAFQSFQRHAEALAYLRAAFHAGSPLVIKTSGLAAGKGVILPETLAEAEQALEQIMLAHEFGAAGDEVVIEERLSGPEVSLIAFCDGKLARPMLPAQDHKRVYDGDQGPNTGGMGAYAPLPVCPPELVTELTRLILQPAVDGLRAEGCPFVGALYAGLMLTPHGPRVIEFNCRFGDPETQVILPLLESDILEIFLACAEGRLDQAAIDWRRGAAACVVLASGGYPGKYAVGREITGEITGLIAHSQKDSSEDSFIFHAGTKTDADGRLLTAGGRVLCVSGWGADIHQALDAAYRAVQTIQFEGMHYRKDIGWRAR